jgi:hypothetical protein
MTGEAVLTADEIRSLAVRKCGDPWQSKMADDVVAIAGCQKKHAVKAIHRLATGTTKATALAEVAIRLLTA